LTLCFVLDLLHKTNTIMNTSTCTIKTTASESQFGEMVAKEIKSLKQLAMQLTRNLDDCDDLVQETMLKAIRYRSHFETGTNLKGWLYTILKNSFINNYRRNAKRKTFIDTTDNLYFVDIPNQKTVNVAELKFIREDLEKAIALLPEDIKTTFKLNMVGYKYHEIAEHFNIPIGTVKTRIFVARRLLRKSLSQYGEALGLA